MSHPESIPNSRTEIRDDRDPSWTPIDPTDFSTHHEQSDGSHLIVASETVAEASNRLYLERMAKARGDTPAPPEPRPEPPIEDKNVDPIKNGLYRINKSGHAMRPVKSSDAFLAAAGVARGAEGNQGSYISIGKDEKRPSNEKRDIEEHAGAIIASYEARDKARSEGLSIEEAQDIGAAAYRAALYETSEPKSDPITPESPTEPVVIAEIIDDEPADDTPESKDEDIVDAEIVDDASETSEKDSDGKVESKERSPTEKIASFVRTTGRHAVVAYKTAQAAGVSNLATGAYYKVADVLKPKADKAAEEIEAFLIDLKVDARLSSENTVEKFKSVVKAAGERRNEFVDLWAARKARAETNKRARSESREVTRAEDNERAKRIANDIRSYLESKRKLFT